MRPGDLVAVVLAGGRSSRMGEEKALMPAGDGSVSLLFDRVELLRSFGVGRVMVSSRPDLDWAAGGADVVHDEERGQGPLGGLLAAMHAEPGRPLLVLAVDMPHVDRELLGSLASGATPRWGVAPRSDGRWEPLCAVYPPGTEPLARAFLKLGRGSPTALLDELAVRGRMRSHVVDPVDAWRLTSWNRPEDVGGPPLARQARMASGAGRESPDP